MAHNPPRQPLGADAVASVRDDVARSIRRSARNWTTIEDLARCIADLARLGKTVRLTPHTAAVVAGQLKVAASKPSRDDVALMICRRKSDDRCSQPCYECRGRANEIVRAYGAALDRPSSD